MKKSMPRHIAAVVPTVALVICVATASSVHAADPTTADCLSANETSIALRVQHKLRAARGHLLVCATATCPTDIRNECIRRVAELNAAMPTVVFEAKNSAGNDVSSVRVTVDGEPFVDRLEGTSLSIDPGEHSFTFETEGEAKVEKSFVIHEGEKDRREQITFRTIVPPVPSTTLLPRPPSPTLMETSHGLGTQKIFAIVAAGVGVVGVSVGAVFGVQAMSKHTDAATACPLQCETQRGVDLWANARVAGNASTVGFVVGGAAVAGAAVLWFTVKPEPKRTPSVRVGVSPVAVELKGAW